jgi:hypothetical protein
MITAATNSESYVVMAPSCCIFCNKYNPIGEINLPIAMDHCNYPCTVGAALLKTTPRCTSKLRCRQCGNSGGHQVLLCCSTCVLDFLYTYQVLMDVLILHKQNCGMKTEKIIRIPAYRLLEKRLSLSPVRLYI